MSARCLALIALVSLALALPRAAAGVIVVDPPSGPAAQAAIDAAAPGDLLLFKPSASDVSAHLVVDGKALALVADGAGITFLKLTIRNLPVGQQVTVRGLTIGGHGGASEPFPSTPALSISACAGSVWLDACTVIGPPQDAGFGSSPPGPAGATVTGSGSVLFTACQVSGGNGAGPVLDCLGIGGPASVGGPGISVSASRLTLHGTSSTGGLGRIGGSCTPSSGGGEGLRVANASSVHVAASTLTGGLGAPAGTVGSAGPSGSGLVVEDAASSVTRRDSTVAHGAFTPFNPDIVAPAGTVSDYPAPARTLALTSPLREGQGGTLAIDGQAGDLVALFIAFTGGTLPLSGKQGVFSLGSPFFGPLILGTNPSGLLNLPFNAPALVPASSLGQSFLLQLVVHDGSQVLFEGTSTLTIVDSTIP